VWIELENALAELPPEQREIFELTELDGIPVKEISETTEIPVNTLLSRKHYAVKHLRRRLSELYEDIVYTA
jgi:RNA polymerase sigma factor (sigma-70 family)